MKLSLFQRPGTVVFLDDDIDYLDMLGMVLPRQWHIRLFSRPNDCINYLQQEPPFWEADAWNQQQLVDQWRAGKPLIPQILAYWAKYSERWALSRVCVVDYSMPAMNGLDVLDELVDWPGSRMLLTGQADEQIAVSAFNRGLIDQFIAKQSADISHRLIDAVARLVAVPSARHAQIWRATLTPEQNALLRVPSVNNELGEFVESRWIEYVVIGDPFGVLGIDSEGRVGWLQLETEAGLHDLSDIATAEGLDADTVEDIRAGRKLVNLELRQALGRDLPLERHPAFSLGRNEKLLGALFTLPAQFCPAPANSYSQWLARQGPRKVLQ